MVNTTARMGTTVVMINFAMLKILLVLLVLISFWSSGTFLSNPWWLITSSSSLNNSIIVKRTTYHQVYKLFLANPQFIMPSLKTLHFYIFLHSKFVSSMKGTSCVKMSQMSTIRTQEVAGSFPITLSGNGWSLINCSYEFT